MNLKLPESARDYQNIQHLIGGLYNILLMITGALFGRGDWVVGIILGVITFIINRLSSEIAYQIQLRLIKEHSTR